MGTSQSCSGASTLGGTPHVKSKPYLVGTQIVANELRYPKINMFILSIYEIDKIDSEISRWPPLKWMTHGWYHIEYQTFLHYNWPIAFEKCTKYYHGITQFEINMQ